MVLLVDGLVLRDPVNMNEALGVKEREDHGLLLQSVHPCLLGPEGVLVLPVSTLTLALRVVSKDPTLVVS